MNSVTIIKSLLIVFAVLTAGLLLIPEQEETSVETPKELPEIAIETSSEKQTNDIKNDIPEEDIKTVINNPDKEQNEKIEIVSSNTTKQEKKKEAKKSDKYVRKNKKKTKPKSRPKQKKIVYAHAGVILFANGKVTAKSKDGKTRTLKRGSNVNVGDTIFTGTSSQAQIRAGDGSMFSLNASSKLIIIEHQYTGDIEKQSSVIELVKGGMRAVTGLIGKNKPESFKIKVKQATIGIRGTEFVIQVCDDACARNKKKVSGEPSGNGVYVGVLSGAVEVEQKEQKVQLDASLNVVMGVSMGVDKSKKQYLFIGEKKDEPVQTLEKPPEVILQALAPPPPAKVSKKEKKEKTHSLKPYSGIDTKVYAAHMDATLPVEKPLSATDKFDQLAFPGRPDVYIRQRFLLPRYYGYDNNIGELLDLNQGDLRYRYYFFY